MAEELKLPIKTVVDYSDLDRMPNQVERAARTAQRRAQTALRDPRTGRFAGGPALFGNVEGAQAAFSPRPSGPTFIPPRPRPQLSAEQKRRADEEYIYQQAKAQSFLDKVDRPIAKKAADARVMEFDKAERRIGETRKQWFQRLEGMDRAAARRRELEFRRPRQRAALGALRGFGQEALQGTGVPFPFLGMGAAFIGGAVAAGVAAQAVRASLDQTMAVGKATRGLSTDLNITRAASARFIATGQQFNVTSEHMTKALSHAGQQIQTNRELFRRLGVDLYDTTGRTRDWAEVLDDARDAISRIEDQGTQASVAMELLGETAKTTVPWWRATAAQISGSQGVIDSQAAAIERAAAVTERWDNATARLGASMARLGQNVGVPLVEGLSTALETVMDESITIPQKRVEAMVDEILRGRGLDIPVEPTIKPSAVRDAHDRLSQEIGVSKVPVVQLQVEYQNAIEAVQVVQNLQQSMVDLKHAQETRVFAYDMMLRNWDNFLEDREMALEMRTAALTMTLGEFRKAEQTEAQRARSQERFFIAFRPAWNLQWQQEDRRFERTKTQMSLQLGFTAKQNMWAEEREKNEARIIGLRMGLEATRGSTLDREERLVAAHKDLQDRLEAIGFGTAGGVQALDMTVNLLSTGIDWSKIGLSREDAELLFITIFERVALESRSHIRQASASVGGTFMVTQ